MFVQTLIKNISTIISLYVLASLKTVLLLNYFPEQVTTVAEAHTTLPAGNPSLHYIHFYGYVQKSVYVADF